jgi:MFS-type transporter involved in bile tolerance (Atg22 family)
MAAMVATDIYHPAEWHDYFMTTGGGAAALAGLVFVAMSINLDVVAQNETHRLRAINMLTGFTAAFIICALALMGGQSHQAVGAEWFVVAAVAATSYVHNYVQAARRGGRKAELRPYRLAGGTACYVAEMVGAVVLIFGHVAGLYVAAVGLTILLAFMISGAWLLLVAVHEDRSRDPASPR